MQVIDAIKFPYEGVEIVFPITFLSCLEELYVYVFQLNDERLLNDFINVKKSMPWRRISMWVRNVGGRLNKYVTPRFWLQFYFHLYLKNIKFHSVSIFTSNKQYYLFITGLQLNGRWNRTLRVGLSATAEQDDTVFNSLDFSDIIL